MAKYLKWLVVSMAVLASQALIATGANAFECPKHFAAAQAAIDKLAGDMGGAMSQRMEMSDLMLVHALLGDAKIMLQSAIDVHGNARGGYDHARSIAKADAALGYARAADILHFSMMKK